MKWMIVVLALAAGCAEGATLPFAVDRDDSDHCDSPRTDAESRGCREAQQRSEDRRQALLTVMAGLRGAGNALVSQPRVQLVTPASAACMSQIAGSVVYTSCN